MPDIRLIPCLSDNYAVLLRDGDTVVLVDAPEAGPIKAVLDKEGWHLSHILVTHKHADHVDGIPALVKEYGPEVIGPAAEKTQIPHIRTAVREGDIVTVGPFTADVYDTPGHTKGHIVYHLPKEKLLFAGDTMFALGCGRLLEDTPAAMWNSLKKLRALPDDTNVYCGHEYTLSNARFAQPLDPDNAELAARAAEIAKTRAAGRPTVPFNLGLEKRTSPFLRADDPAVARGVGKAGAAPEEVFAEVRERKNRA